MSNIRYGYIGLGHLGAKLAGSLLREGFALTVHDLNRDLAAPLLGAGALWAESPKVLAASCDAVITCLPSPAVSEKVLCGADGIIAGLKRGGT
jgi:3-hydroxyisobutyrate dehydrogenase